MVIYRSLRLSVKYRFLGRKKKARYEVGL